MKKLVHDRTVRLRAGGTSRTGVICSFSIVEDSSERVEGGRAFGSGGGSGTLSDDGGAGGV